MTNIGEIKTSNAYHVSPGYKMRIEGFNNAGQEWDYYVTLYMIREARIN